MILSILICTIPKRKAMFDRLYLELRTQVLASGQLVEILSDINDGSVGAKRQRLLNVAQGEYVVFVDDDDWISHDYISSILAALELKPDVVGFYGWITTNGQNKKKFKLSKHCDYLDKITHYERFNNHLCPVKRDIALQIGYKDISWQEDYDYAVRLRNSGLAKEEAFIAKYLYFYKYVTKKTYT